MDYAKNILEKYGWKEGEGLGKNRDGIAAPLKTCMKQNNHGIGYNFGVEFSDNWWEKVFNHAAQNIVPLKDSEGSVTKMAINKDTTTTQRKRKDVAYTYGSFKRKSRLINDKSVSISDSTSSSDDEASSPVNDDNIFNICDRRTGHKGSRHGLTLSGKLARLEQHEKLESNDPIPCSPLPSNEIASSVVEEEIDEQPNKKKRKKKKKSKNQNQETFKLEITFLPNVLEEFSDRYDCEKVKCSSS